MEPGRSAAKLTYADYVALPDDGLRHEIIDGAHYVTPSPVVRHQRISRDLLLFLAIYLRTHPIGEVLDAPCDVLLSETDIVVPDLVFVSKARAHLITEKNLQGPPDLVVEILSPGTRSRDLRLKHDLYERAGVEEYWVVDPDTDVVDVYRRAGSTFGDPVRRTRDDVVTTPILPGLEMPLDTIFGT